MPLPFLSNDLFSPLFDLLFKTMNISPNPTASSSSPNSIDFAGRVLAPLGVTLFLLLVIVTSYILARKRQSAGVLLDETVIGGAEDEMDEDDYVGVDEETMRSFPKFAYSQLPECALREPSMETTGGSCTICLREYEEADVIRMVPVCNHFFHQGCVDQWLKHHSTCPICRVSLIRSTWFFRLN